MHVQDGTKFQQVAVAIMVSNSLAGRKLLSDCEADYIITVNIL